jgi:hypothetical protein
MGWVVRGESRRDGSSSARVFNWIEFEFEFGFENKINGKNIFSLRIRFGTEDEVEKRKKVFNQRNSSDFL